MQNTSATYNSLWGEKNHIIEVKVLIDNVEYGSDKIFSLSINRQLYANGVPEIGCCTSAECELQLLKTIQDIPTRARVIPYVRLKLGDTVSEWIKKGEFFIDTREYTSYSQGHNTITLHCYDSMLMFDRVLSEVSSSITFPCYYNEYINKALGYIDKTPTTSVASGILDFYYHCVVYNVVPTITENGRTIRSILCDIATTLGGNFIFDEENELQFIPLKCIKQNDAGYLADEGGNRFVFGDTRIVLGESIQSVGESYSDFYTSPALLPFEGAVLKSEQESAKTHAGTSSNWRNIEGKVSLPFYDNLYNLSVAAGYVADEILGYEYQPYTANGVILNPATQLGDTISINGITSIVAKISTEYDSLSVATISAPCDEEMNYEYTYKSPEQEQISSKVTMGTSYGGTTISKNGITSKAGGFELLDSDGNRCVYFDGDSHTYKFVGDIEIADGSISFTKFNSQTQTRTDVQALMNGNSSLVGTFISGSAIYSPTIFANQFNVFPNNSQVTSGAFNIMGAFNSSTYQMFSIEYYPSGDSPIINIGSPDNADIYLGRATKNGNTISNRVFLDGKEIYVSGSYVRVR